MWNHFGWGENNLRRERKSSAQSDRRSRRASSRTRTARGHASDVKAGLRARCAMLAFPAQVRQWQMEHSEGNLPLRGQQRSRLSEMPNRTAFPFHLSHDGLWEGTLRGRSVAQPRNRLAYTCGAKTAISRRYLPKNAVFTPQVSSSRFPQ